jgi:hypothetical protein
MITINNYFDSIKTLHVTKFPKELKFGYDFTKDVTENHTTWDYYYEDDDLKANVDEYLANLKAYLAKENNPPKKETNSKSVSENSAREAAKNFIRSYVTRGDSYESLKRGQMGARIDAYNARINGNKIEITQVNGITSDWNFSLQSIFNEVAEESGKAKTKANTTKTANQKETPKKEPSANQKTKSGQKKASAKQTEPNLVERIDEDVRFIRRFVLLNKKEKTNEQILSFINQLQKAIIDKRIRKTSPYAKQIEFVQDSLLKFYKSMKRKGTLEISDNVLELLTTIGGSEKVRLSINYMKRFVGIHGKQITKDKAKHLFNLIVDAKEKGKIKKTDPYFKKINEVLASLKHFYEIAKRNETLEVHQAVLNGLEGTLSGIGCVECGDKKKRCKSSLNGLEEIEEYTNPSPTENRVMSSMDFAELEFDTIGFMGKWKELMGDPSEGFKAMISGKPKMGKSYFAIDWAGYLARHHGNVLYVAKEEKLDMTLQKKIKEMEVEHPNLFVSNYLMDDLTPYQYIFLDSVTSLHFSSEDLKMLENNNIGKSFIYVHQVNKAGKARGTNEFVHNVDIVIEIPERGKAIQFGRFNQGGEMEIFE